jgi:tRNA/rRNA methyltransferase
LPLAADLTRLHVVLVRTRNPLNIGAAARAMSNFGFSSLRVVKPYEEAFREARSAVGASSVLQKAEEYATVAEAVADCSLVLGTTAARARELRHPLKPLEEAAQIVRHQLASGRVALLFGSEKTGLSNKDMSHCHSLLRIPTREEHSSMNLGQAVAVSLYELIRKHKVGVEPELSPRASSAELDRIAATLVEGLRLSGYFPPASSSRSDEKIRRLIHRLQLPAEDADIWIGILRQLLWKLKNPA